MVRNLITETIERNTIRVLEKYPELAYLEPTPISDYHLQKTFEASKTSYRILMFLHIFRRTAIGTPKKSIQQLRDNAFARYGAPLPGGAAYLATTIRKIHQVNSFYHFIGIMGPPPMPKEWFSGFLKARMQAAIAKGYCSVPFNQQQAMYLRREKETDVEPFASNQGKSSDDRETDPLFMFQRTVAG
ncbi:hypothetical protein IFR05_001134 [Cadophora sp. M221]|nr:hypothetical protein IFR05_001134 [Cadophora sp. M221]